MRQRHPAGLYVLFFTEMWERFGFYCMAAVFRLYLKSSRYEFLNNHGDEIWGIYLAGVYFTPFFGGILADWKFGYRLSIIAGSIVMAAGYLLLSIEPAICFAVGLGLVMIGNGLFKPNISSLVGKLYPPGDPRVDSAFTIFYMGINIGALISPIAASMVANVVASYEGDPDGYLAAFGVASAGMVISLVIFLLFKHLVIEDADRLGTEGQQTPRLDGSVSDDRQSLRNVALAVFFAINILFWMAFKQNGNTLALWAEERTDRAPPEWLAASLTNIRLDHILLTKDGLMGPPLFAAINPFFVIALSPIFVWVWGALRRVGYDVPTPAKLVLGFVLTASAFIIMWRVAANAGPTARVTPWALVATYAVLTSGELCLSPMGLSLVSKLAAARTRSVWMGGFFASTAIGGYLSGGLRAWVKHWPYADFFLLLAGTSAFAMLLMLAAYPLIARALRPAPASTS